MNKKRLLLILIYNCLNNFITYDYFNKFLIKKKKNKKKLKKKKQEIILKQELKKELKNKKINIVNDKSNNTINNTIIIIILFIILSGGCIILALPLLTKKKLTSLDEKLFKKLSENPDERYKTYYNYMNIPIVIDSNSKTKIDDLQSLYPNIFQNNEIIIPIIKFDTTLMTLIHEIMKNMPNITNSIVTNIQNDDSKTIEDNFINNEHIYRIETYHSINQLQPYCKIFKQSKLINTEDPILYVHKYKEFKKLSIFEFINTQQITMELHYKKEKDELSIHYTIDNKSNKENNNDKKTIYITSDKTKTVLIDKSLNIIADLKETQELRNLKTLLETLINYN